MEHRLGSRHATDVDVFLRTWGSTVSAKGRLRDLSVSGAFISTLLPCRPLLHVTVQVAPNGRPRRGGPVLEGQIVRLTEGGIGIEWAELQPELVAQLVLVQHADEQMRANSTQWM
jgi:PilZ domain